MRVKGLLKGLGIYKHVLMYIKMFSHSSNVVFIKRNWVHPAGTVKNVIIVGFFCLFLPGLSHLVGSSFLRAYMHGFFMDIRLYLKVGSLLLDHLVFSYLF